MERSVRPGPRLVNQGTARGRKSSLLRITIADLQENGVMIRPTTRVN